MVGTAPEGRRQESSDVQARVGAQGCPQKDPVLQAAWPQWGAHVAPRDHGALSRCWCQEAVGGEPHVRSTPGFTGLVKVSI